MRPPAFSTLDTNYLGLAGTALAFVVHSDEGPVLVECGTAASFELVRAQLAALGLAPRDLRGLLVTHIHLDHAGAAGHFAREGVPVFVHPRGVRHLLDPARLIAGSRAVHGTRYERFYGDPLEIAPERVHSVPDGATVAVAGLCFTAIETPGHARHHHAWLVRTAAGDELAGGASQLLFTGDVLAMITPGSRFISVPVPPSDIDIPAWRGSVARLRALPRDTRAVLTHGGERALGEHIDAFVARMHAELPLLARLAPLSATDPPAADAEYRDFLLPMARAAGVSEDLAQALLGGAFRAMNLAGIRQALEAGLFAERVE